MKDMNHLINIAGQTHQHMPALLSLLVGLIVIKERSYFFNDDDVVGDNLPAVFMKKEGDTR